MIFLNRNPTLGPTSFWPLDLHDLSSYLFWRLPQMSSLCCWYLSEEAYMGCFSFLKIVEHF